MPASGATATTAATAAALMPPLDPAALAAIFEARPGGYPTFDGTSSTSSFHHTAVILTIAMTAVPPCLTHLRIFICHSRDHSVPELE